MRALKTLWALCHRFVENSQHFSLIGCERKRRAEWTLVSSWKKMLNIVRCDVVNKSFSVIERLFSCCPFCPFILGYFLIFFRIFLSPNSKGQCPSYVHTLQIPMMILGVCFFFFLFRKIIFDQKNTVIFSKVYDITIKVYIFSRSDIGVL